MTKFVGRLLQIGVAREADRGAGASATYRLPQTAFSFDDKVVKARSIGGLGKISDSEEAFVTTRYGQGDFEGEVRAKSFGLLLYAMLGSLSSGSVVDESYTHSVTVNQGNQHQSLCFVVVDENTSEIYRLVMLDSLEIVSELDEVVRYTASFMSKASRGTDETVPIAVDEPKFTKKHLRLSIADTIGELPATLISVKSLALTIAKNVTLDDVLGTAEPEDILNRQLSIEGSITLNYEAETYKNYMRSGDHKAMEIHFLNTDETIGAGATNPSLKIQLPRVDFFDWEPSYDLDEIVSQVISFKASRDVANAQDIVHLCELVNAVSSYS